MTSLRWLILIWQQWAAGLCGDAGIQARQGGHRGCGCG
jgi:hypothetical protein